MASPLSPARRAVRLPARARPAPQMAKRPLSVGHSPFEAKASKPPAGAEDAQLSFADRLAAAPAVSAGRRWQAGPSRENKNRPTEMSSKRMVKRFRVASGLTAEDQSKKNLRDPRFDALAAGEAEPHAHSKYAFLEKMHRQEVEDIKERLAQSKAASKKRGRNGKQRQRLSEARLSEEEEEQLKDKLSRMQNQLKTREKFEQQRKAKATVRKEEVAAIEQGKRPYFAKPSVLKEQALLSKYEELRSSGQLEKFMAKKRQRGAAKVHKLIPRERR